MLSFLLRHVNQLVRGFGCLEGSFNDSIWCADECEDCSVCGGSGVHAKNTDAFRVSYRIGNCVKSLKKMMYKVELLCDRSLRSTKSHLFLDALGEIGHALD